MPGANMTLLWWPVWLALKQRQVPHPLTLHEWTSTQFDRTLDGGCVRYSERRILVEIKVCSVEGAVGT